MTRRLVLLGASLLAAGAAAQTAIPESAYRKGMPDVMTPAPVVAAPGTMFDRASFASAYARAGRPAVVVLWNRQFTDVLQQSTAQQTSIDTVRAGATRAEAVRLPGYAAVQAEGSVVGNTTITSGEVRSQQGQRSAPIERVDLQMRAAFMQTLSSNGLRVVDRNVTMRTTAAQSKGTHDTQQVETQALSRHAKLMMEVLNTPDPAAPTGWATYVSIKRLADGVVLAEGYMTGESNAPKAAPRYEADPSGGFREVATPAVTPSDAARNVAEQSLQRLRASL
jgi:hypothetical protein